MALTDEDIIRDLLHRGTPQVNLPAALAAGVVARQRRRDRRGRVLSLAATGTALAAAVGVIALTPGRAARAVKPAPSARPAIRLTDGQRELYRLSSAAAGQPAGHGRYVVMSTESFDDHVLETEDTSVIDSRTGTMWSYQRGRDGAPSGAGPVSRHYSPTAAQFAAMPTGLTALREALIAQWDAQQAAASSARTQLRKLRRGPAPEPAPLAISDGDKVFQQASALLWNPLVGPGLRAALYKVLAATPGVTVNPSARDLLGQPAVEISRTDTSGYSRNRSDGVTYATYESPATGAVLQTSQTYPPGADMVSPLDPRGTATDVESAAYLSVTRSNTIPSDPYRG